MNLALLLDAGSWTAIVPGIIVSVVSFIVLWVVKRAAQALKDTWENLATRDFVSTTLAEHRKAMLQEIEQVLLKFTAQDRRNADVERRLRRIEQMGGIHPEPGDIPE